MSFESLKITKQILTALSDMGIQEPRNVQEKTLSRISGGQELVVIGPEGCGKSLTLSIATVSKLKYAIEIAPRVLILVASKEHGMLLEETIKQVAINTDLRVMGMYAGQGIEGQRERLEMGVDIVIGTPDRIETLYIRSGINLNQLKLVIVDDADLIIKQGWQTIIKNLSDSLPKCQRVYFSEVNHTKLDKLVELTMTIPQFVEIEFQSELQLHTMHYALYQVLNYKTKLNLLNLLIRNEVYQQLVLVVNTYATAEQLYKSLDKRITGEVALYQAKGKQKKVNDLKTFQTDSSIKVWVVALEQEFNEPLYHCAEVLFFDLPLSPFDILKYTELKPADETVTLGQAHFFATDIELNVVAKLEQLSGKKMETLDLPLDLIVEGNRKRDKTSTANPGKHKEELYIPGAAFHEKKESNAKNYNYSYKDKLKMNGKLGKGKDRN
jgi:ATP-dependent RNA helicase RhlE